MNSDLKFCLLTALGTVAGLLALQFVQSELMKRGGSTRALPKSSSKGAAPKVLHHSQVTM